MNYKIAANMPVMQQPAIYLGNAHELFDENGKAVKTL